MSSLVPLCEPSWLWQHIFFSLWNVTFHFIPLPKLWHLFEVGTSKSFNKVRVKSGSYLKRNSGKISIIFVVQHKRPFCLKTLNHFSQGSSLQGPCLVCLLSALELKNIYFRTISKEPIIRVKLSKFYKLVPSWAFSKEQDYKREKPLP